MFSRAFPSGIATPGALPLQPDGASRSAAVGVVAITTALEKWRMRPAPGEWARASALVIFQSGREVGWAVEIKQRLSQVLQLLQWQRLNAGGGGLAEGTAAAVEQAPGDGGFSECPSPIQKVLGGARVEQLVGGEAVRSASLAALWTSDNDYWVMNNLPSPREPCRLLRLPSLRSLGERQALLLSVPRQSRSDPALA